MKKSLPFLVFVCLSTLLYAQKKQTAKQITLVPKQPLTHSVYDSWKEITYKALTNDGHFAAFTVNPQEGDGKVIFYNLKTNTEDSIKRAESIWLTFDSKFAVFKIKPQLKLVKDLRRHKKKKEDLPKDSLGIFSFETRKLIKIPEVKSYRVPEKKGEWLAYLLEAKKADKPKKDDKSKTEEKKPEKPKKKTKANTDDNGYTLMLRHLPDGKETPFGYVREYGFTKYGHALWFVSSGNDSTLKAGVYYYDLAIEKMHALYEGKSQYKFKGVSASEDGSQLAFLVDTDTTKALIHEYQLYYWKNSDEAAKQQEVQKSMALPQNWLLNEYYGTRFSKDGNKLFFGTSPKPVVQDTLLLPEEIVNVEIWRSEDGLIYPQQNKQLDAERKRSYLAVLDLPNKAVTQIGSKEIPSVEIANEGNASVFLGETSLPYQKNITWEGAPAADFFLFDIAGKIKKSIAKNVRANASFSPLGNFVFWYSLEDTAWFSYSVANEKSSKLNEGLKIKFADEEDDHPGFPNPYGLAGWTKNDAQLIIYDRYDLWAFDGENKNKPVNLTKIGRSQKIVFRYLRLDWEERFIDPEKEMLLSAFDETTKASGYYKLSLKDGKLTRLMMDDYRFAGTVKARNDQQLLFTRESFREFPDVWTSDFNFTAVKKISNANPQIKNYVWGNVEMVNWVSLDNIPLQGLLYKPDHFDPKKKYPMLVYFYEKNSDNLHSHFAPAPIRSYINYSLYVSNGYLVFVPDIVYKIGSPGASAYNCVMPGVASLMAKGFVDEKHIGMQGHSWGGYQTAYLVTRTDLFAAAEAGAPVSNMISAYGGVRWESGMSRMFQYEHTQSRIGGTLWEKPMSYIENSPIFAANKVNTPLLMMHNDADGAVPWYQGIEYYMALRRLNKPVWMLNYNGQGHGLTQRQDRTDFAIRMMQFFDHYLKGKPAPEWMTQGVPATEKGITKGY
ncbi:MAG: S9 family peptidase [Bacteroidetes bacterium]|nr:S9 family peptidase [Bacteroidota bacterium]